ncbi:MAG: aminotransferase class V-fold PLP-dependent enzyme [Acidimicrobiia bacterium]|nr:aminotransferase class V-fold PLP-dependent enzyme [Acidimicrobiia bacterium]
MSIWRLDPDVIHLNHGSFGATPIAALEEQQRLRDAMESNPTRWFLQDYQPSLDAARSQVAEFVGADPTWLGFVNNVTEGVNSVLRSLETSLGPGDEMVMTDHIYNACRNALEVTAARCGARLVTVGVPFPIQSVQEVTDLILGAVTDRTKLLMIDWVTSPTALVLPLEDIVSALEPDVQVLVDAAHGPGMIDIDLTALGASYVTFNCHKWMCSPKGSGILYVREDHRERIYPAVISHGYNGGWPAEGGHLHTQFDWTGTDDPTAWLATPTALEAVAGLQPDGWEGIRRTNRELCLTGRDMLADLLGIDPPAPDDMIGSIASVPLPDHLPGGGTIFNPLMTRLRTEWDIEVMVMSWPDPSRSLLRISTQQYNIIEDLERLAEAVKSELNL